jgi:hypothetical protein
LGIQKLPILQGPLWWCSYGSCIYNYLCSQCLPPLTLWIRISFSPGVLDTTLYDKVFQWLATGRWLNTITLSLTLIEIKMTDEKKEACWWLVCNSCGKYKLHWVNWYCYNKCQILQNNKYTHLNNHKWGRVSARYIVYHYPSNGEVYSIQHYMIKFFSGLQQIGG